MTLILMEGWDSLAYLGRKYSTGGSPTLNSSIKRNGSQSLRAAAQSHYVTMPLESDYSVFYVGFALYVDTSAGVLNDSGCFLRIRTTSGVQCGVGLSVTNKLVVYCGSTLLGESDNNLTNDTWYYVEVKVTISNSISLGDFQIKVNEAVWLNLIAGKDTQAQAVNTANEVILAGNYLSGVLYFDDLYILNTSGTKNNTFLGDVKIVTLYPNGNGNANQFDGSDGNQVDNYLLVDDAQDDTDATYVESSTASEKDQYAFDNISDTPETIHAVSCRSVARKTDSGSRTGRLLCRSGGSDYEGSDFNPGTSYLAYDNIWEDNPSGPTAWTKTAIDAAEFGIKVQA